MEKVTFQRDDVVDEKLVQELADIQKLNTQAPYKGSFSSLRTAPQFIFSGFWRRVGATLVDQFLIRWIISFAISFFMYGRFSFLGLSDLARLLFFSFFPYLQFSEYTYYQFSNPQYLFFSYTPLVVMWIYFAFFHSRNGQTIGKMIFRIKVVKTSGGFMNFPHALGREIAKLLSSIVLCLGYLWMLWDKDKRTWHDMIAKTYVIKIIK